MTTHRDDPTSLADALRAAAPAAFGDGFSERVMRRLDAARAEPAFPDLLQRQFVRIVPLAAAAALLLATYNWWGGHRAGMSAIDAALNLPQVTVASVYSPSVLYGAQWTEVR